MYGFVQGSDNLSKRRAVVHPPPLKIRGHIPTYGGSHAPIKHLSYSQSLVAVFHRDQIIFLHILVVCCSGNYFRKPFKTEQNNFLGIVGLLRERLKNGIPLQYKGLILDLVTILPLDHFLNLDNWPAQSGVYNGEFFF